MLRNKCVCGGGGGEGVLSCLNCAPITMVGACTAKLIVLTLTFLYVFYTNCDWRGCCLMLRRWSSMPAQIQLEGRVQSKVSERCEP